MNVLLDIHHLDLFRSLYILFKHRLGFNVYIPYGLDWNSLHGYAPYTDANIVSQYLVSVKDWLNIGNDMDTVSFLSLQEFKEIKIDIMVSSLVENFFVFKNINSLYDKKSKLIFQCGNNFSVEVIDSVCENLMTSSFVIHELSMIKHKIFYHQEFDLTQFKPIKKFQNVASMCSLQHYFCSNTSPYIHDFELYKKIQKSLPEFDFRCYGCGNVDGTIDNIPKTMANVINSVGFIFHVKPQGDGYGHTYHNAFACGKPILYKSEYLYYNTLKMTPLIWLETTDSMIDLSKLSFVEVIDKILRITGDYTNYSNQIYESFKKNIDFDREFFYIKNFIENLT